MANEAKNLIHDLDQKVISRLSQRKYNDFFQELENIYSYYISLLDELSIKNAHGNMITLGEISAHLEHIKKVCDDIKRMIESYLNGNLIQLGKIYNRLFRSTANRPPLSSHFPKITIEQDSLWYRGRGYKGKNMEMKDLFHVPFEKRGKIGVNRFSVIGYPCLYLASSINCCIKENHCANPICISAFKPTSEFTVYDFTFFPHVPSAKEIWSHLYTYPIKIACSIPVQEGDRGNSFIPEYIIPEYVLHGTIKQTKASKPLGIAYTSTNVFSTSVTKEIAIEHINLAIPTVQIRDKGFCKNLSKLFPLTKPITLHLSDCINEDILKAQRDELNGMVFGPLKET